MSFDRQRTEIFVVGDYAPVPSAAQWTFIPGSNGRDNLCLDEGCEDWPDEPDSIVLDADRKTLLLKCATGILHMVRDYDGPETPFDVVVSGTYTGKPGNKLNVTYQ